MLRDFFLGFIKIHVLHHAAQEPIYGVAMIAELARHGYDLSPGTLYPLLHSLEEQGYLTRTDQVVDGRVRKYYAITVEGRAALQEAKHKIAELVQEVLEEGEQQESIMTLIFQTKFDGLVRCKMRHAKKEMEAVYSRL